MRNYHSCWNICIDARYYETLRGAFAGTPLAGSYTYWDAYRDICNYENRIEELLNGLLKTWTGWAVLTEIWRCSPKEMRIKPALEIAHVNAANQRMLSYVAGEPVGDPNDPGYFYLDENASATPGPAALPRTGTVVYFSPEFCERPGMAYTKAGPGTDPDETLLHEMSHGARYLRGLFNAFSNRKPPDNPDWNNDEEFYAIVLTNIYRSELRTRGSARPGLRKDHKGHAPLPPQFENPTTFVNFGQNRSRFQRWEREQHQLFDDLRRVRCAFNPVRAFRGDPVP